MRRIIAEDPAWNTTSVPSLVDACIDYLVKSFQSRPSLSMLPIKFQKRVLDKLSVVSCVV